MTRILAVWLVALLGTASLYGQGGAYGTILGTVTDNSGAVVANASVDVTNLGTNVSKHTATTSSGDFTVPYLAPGLYRVTVQSQGFRKSVLDNIALVVGQEARANVTLKTGEVTETVEVQANAAALDTDSSAVSQLVSEKQVEELPLNGRNFLNLLFIGAGAVQTVGEQGQMRQGAGNAISINGGRPESNNYTLDGLTNTDTALNTPAVIVSQDAIQEFKVASENYSAEYGYSANQVNIISKSGTNQLHGTAFEFLRNDALDALTPTPFQTPIKSELRQNQFGFVVGGPVYIPKVYDGRNKTFWLVNYEGWRIRNGFVVRGQVPDPAQLSGDFSASGLPDYGSAACDTGYAQSTPQPCMPVDPLTGNPFPGNIIPAARFSRLANVALAAQVFPAPTPLCLSDPTACQGNNYQRALALPNTTNQQTYKVDQALGRWGSLFFRYTKSSFTNENPQNLSPAFSINNFTEDTTSWMFSHTITLGHSTVNNFRFGFLHPTAIQGAPPLSPDQVSALGLTGVFTNLPAYARGFPTITLTVTNSNLNDSYGSPGNNPTTSDLPTWEFADSISMVRGKHTIGVGFDYRRFIQKRDLSTNFLGGYSYNNNTVVLDTSNGCPAPYVTCGTGNAVADFLLGFYGSANTFQPGPFSKPNVAGNLNQYHFLYFAPYVQDDWKVSNRLTLNLGLRWDYRAVPYEQDNKMFWIDDQNKPGGSRFTGGGLCFANPALATNGVAPPGNGFYNYCGRRNPADGSKTPFAPRFGFAWRPFGGEKTVVRGGYGIFWDSSLSREIDDSGDLYPYVERTQLDTTSQPVSVAPKTTDQLFVPQTAIVPVTAPNSQFVAVIISDHPRNPYVQQYTLSVQRELFRRTNLEVNYVGNRALHLLNRIYLNEPDPIPAATLPTCQAAFAANDSATLTANNCNFFQRFPLPNFSFPGPLNSSWTGYSNYNAGNVKLEHRAADFALLTVYTWAKSMDDKSAPAGIGSAGGGFQGHLDDRNPRLDYGPSDFSVKHRFVNSLVYSLPIGRGKRLLGGTNRAADLAVGGWQLSVITTFQTGFPFSVTATDLGLANGQLGNQRADQVGSPSVSNKSISQWFNTAAFTQPAFGTFGTSRRNILTQPGINNWDIGLAKTFQFTERVGFQFRIETFNTFNHTQYGVDPTAAAAGGPGQSAVDGNINSPTYGDVVSARPGRIVQLGGKIIF
ncbi:MAG TPA: TonB-dependent receptor [Candidatus Sulfotelmatobacter sp.]|nr:TonB-dependent receptor [Candidatus Sulfotelmatobacter sp.]